MRSIREYLNIHNAFISKKVIILILLIGTWHIIKSQEGSTQDWNPADQKTFEAATELFNKRYYGSAYEKYVSLTPNHQDDIFLKFVRGVCAVYIPNKQKEAEKLLVEVKKADTRAEGIDYYLCLLYHKSYRFDKALALANAMLADPNLTKEDRIDIERIAFFSKNGKNEIQYPFETLIEPLGTEINTEYAEYAPIISPEEESVIFTYRGKGSTGGLVNSNNKPDVNGDYNEDIFISKKVNGVWQKPVGIEGLNTIGNDAAVALSPDGKQLFVFKAKGDNGDIYVCKREGGNYSAPEKLAGEVNSDHWEGSVSISTDQQKMYFASSRPGGYGGKDLYVAAKKEDGTWGNVKNLGPKINTSYDEDAPFISPDSRTLIFSSEGHNSIGDFDLFTCNLDLKDGSWQDPKNLGYPVNTTDDDLFYVLSPDGKRGYFSSARDGGKGDQDLYVVEPALSSRKSYITIVKGKVTENKLPFETEISVGVLGETKSYGTYKSGAGSGNYVINLPSGKNYRLSFHHPTLGDKTYNIHTEQVEDYAEKSLNVNFTVKESLKPIEVVVTKADSAKSNVAASTKTTAVAINETKTTGTGSKEKNTDVVKTSEPKTTEKNDDVTKAPATKEKNDVAKVKESQIKEKNRDVEPAMNKAYEPKTTETSNNKQNCGKIKTGHDADFIYKKCDGVWYTKSKPHPYSKYARGFFSEWTSLADNPKANERLDQRYPQK